MEIEEMRRLLNEARERRREAEEKAAVTVVGIRSRKKLNGIAGPGEY